MSLLPFESYTPGDVIALCGALRSGKTLGAVRLCTLLARRYGLALVSNIPVAGAQLLRAYDEFRALRGAVVLWDEIQASLDSREWNKSSSRDITRDLILLGKRGIILVYTSPAFLTVDVRVRRLTRYVYMTARKLRHAGVFYAVYRWYEHPLADDVLVQRYQFALRLDNWYGAYDTLYGLSVDQSLVLA